MPWKLPIVTPEIIAIVCQSHPAPSARNMLRLKSLVSPKSKDRHNENKTRRMPKYMLINQCFRRLACLLILSKLPALKMKQDKPTKKKKKNEYKKKGHLYRLPTIVKNHKNKLPYPNQSIKQRLPHPEPVSQNPHREKNHLKERHDDAQSHLLNTPVGDPDFAFDPVDVLVE